MTGITDHITDHITDRDGPEIESPGHLPGYSSEFQTLSDVMGHFGIETAWVRQAPSGVNQNWIVGDFFGNRYVIREHRETCTTPWPEIVAFNEQALRFGTERFLRRRNHLGEMDPLVTVNRRRFLMRRFIEGEVVSDFSVDQAYRVGKLLAEVAAHQWVRPSIFGASTTSLPREPSPKMPLWMLNQAEEAVAIIRQWAADPDTPSVIIHADPAPSNFVFRDADGTCEPVLFDWEGAGYGHPYLDLAVAIIEGCSHDGYPDMAPTSALVDGYEEVAGEVDMAEVYRAVTVAKSKTAMSRWWRFMPSFSEMQ